MMESVVDRGRGWLAKGPSGPCPLPWPVKNSHKKMATKRVGIYFRYLGPLSEVSGSATIWQNGDILEQWANNSGLIKRYSKLLYTIANAISPHVGVHVKMWNSQLL